MKQYHLITFCLIILLGCEVSTEKKENINQISKVQNLEINFQLPDLDGNIHHSSEWQGKAKLINFWATWCAPCRREIPLLNKTQYTYEKDLQIIGIAVDFVDDVKAYEKEMPFDYPILVGQENAIAIAEAAGIEFIGLPFTMIISAKDELIKTHLGEIKDQHITKIIDILRRIETQELTIDSARNILGNF